jgi:hypothetical protein
MSLSGAVFRLDAPDSWASYPTARHRYKMSHKLTAEVLTSMLRLALDESDFEAWCVVQRIRSGKRAAAVRFWRLP